MKNMLHFGFRLVCEASEVVDGVVNGIEVVKSSKEFWLVDNAHSNVVEIILTLYKLP